MIKTHGHRVTSVVDFGFLAQNFGRWQGPTNECSVNGGDNDMWWEHQYNLSFRMWPMIEYST